MKILIIDSSIANQAQYAEKLHSLHNKDVETLDLHIMLVDATKYQDHLKIMDLVILGSGLGDQATVIARSIKESYPEKNLIVFVNKAQYNGQMIRQSHNIGVRRVMFDLIDNLEFLQELYAIDAEFRRNGQINLGKVITVTSPKGGAGATTLVAALGEITSKMQERTLIIDLDFTTQDLSRSLALYSNKPKSYVRWMDTIDDLTLKSFMEQTTKVDEYVDLISPPVDLKTTHDLGYHHEGTQVLLKIIDLAKYNYQNIIIDLAEPNSPTGEKIMGISDQIAVLTGECALSLTACELFIEKSKEYLNNNDNIRIINAGDRHSLLDLQQSFSGLNLTSKNWIENLPNDADAWTWPGSGKTLFSIGDYRTKLALNNIARKLEVIKEDAVEQEFRTVSRVKLISAPLINRFKQIPLRAKIETDSKKLLPNNSGYSKISA